MDCRLRLADLHAHVAVDGVAGLLEGDLSSLLPQVSPPELVSVEVDCGSVSVVSGAPAISEVGVIDWPLMPLVSAVAEVMILKVEPGG
jgi:hypothetical protein